jgi:hypothetical protein
LQGAKTNTVSVGDGVTTWGDFNALQSGSAQAAIQAAHDALPTSGGTIYLKTGTYDIANTTVTFSNEVILVGDGQASTVIRSTGTAAPLTITGSNISVRDLQFAYVNASSTATELVDIGAAASLLKFQNVNFTEDTPLPAPAFSHAAGATDILIDGCTITLEDGAGNFVTATDFTMRDSEITFDDSNNSGIQFTTTPVRVTIRDTKFTQTTTSAAQDSYGVFFDANSGDDWTVDSCTFIDCDHGIGLRGGDTVWVRNCRFMAPSASTGRTGIHGASGAVGTVTNLSVEGCLFQAFDDPNATNRVAAMDLDTGIEEAGTIKFVNNTVATIGTVANTPDAYGLYLDFVNAVVTNLHVSGNSFKSIQGSTEAFGVRVVLSDGTSSKHLHITDNQFENVGSTTAASVEFGGVWIEQGISDAVISNNTFQGIGNASADPATNTMAVIRVGEPSLTNQSTNLSITGNTMRGLLTAAAKIFYGISVRGGTTTMSISGNLIDVNDADFTGIVVSRAAADTPTISELSIAGNVVTGTATTGIDVLLSATGADAHGRVSITGNVVEGVISARGIGVLGAGASNTSAIRRFAVTGNAVFSNVSTGSAETGIFVTDCTHGTVSANAVEMIGIATGTVGIDCNAAGTEYIMISSNFVQLGESGAGSCLGTGIDLGNLQYCASNYVRAEDTGGAGAAISNSGTDTETRGLLNADNAAESGASLDPAALTSVGLNKRLN